MADKPSEKFNKWAGWTPDLLQRLDIRRQQGALSRYHPNLPVSMLDGLSAMPSVPSAPAVLSSVSV